MALLVGACAPDQQEEPAEPNDEAAPPSVEQPDQHLEEADHSNADGEPATVALVDVNRALLVFGPYGIRKLAGGEQEHIWGSPVVAALPDLRNGAVLQEPDPEDSDTDGHYVRWLPAGADAPEPPFGPPGEHTALHAVEEIDGEPTVLYTRRTGQGDNAVETLYMRSLEPADERQLGVTGRLESGLGGARIFDGQLLFSSCHLDCQLRLVPLGSDPQGDDVVDLLSGPLPIAGLDVADGVAAYVQMPPRGIEVEDVDGPVLWLHDLGTGERRAIPLHIGDLELAALTAHVHLAPDGDAALIGFHPWDDLRTAATLLVDELGTSPRLRWLDTDEHVRFDILDAS